jgi:hypothetical protein
VGSVEKMTAVIPAPSSRIKQQITTVVFQLTDRHPSRPACGVNPPARAR